MAAPGNPGESAAAGIASLPASVEWLGWDGCTLRWKLAQAAAIELRIDGIAFERFGASAGATFARPFECSPSGCVELAFGIALADGTPIGTPWRVRFGEAADAGRDRWTGPPRGMKPLAGTPQLPSRAWAELPPVAVVVPIFNAADSVRRCLDTLALWTPAWAQLVLVDDASTDPAIGTLLDDLARRRGNVRIDRHARNRGYTQGVNTGMAAAGNADVVLLNSDTQVGPRWLESLRLAAYGDDAIGTVTAVSDNAGAFSVPDLEQFCPIPARWDLVAAQRAVLQQAGLRFPELPTGNGFCMFVKRALIARIGVMDADAFPSGYGEENDFCQRAIGAGFRNVIAGNVLVSHERSASFGDARRAVLGAQGMAVLRQRYPRYEADVGATLHGFSRRVLDYRVRRAYADPDGVYAVRAPRPRLLVAADAQDDAPAAPDADADVFVIVRQKDTLSLAQRVEGALLELDSFPAIGAGDRDRRVREWLVAYAFEQVRAAPAGPGAYLIDLAAGLGIPAAA